MKSQLSGTKPVGAALSLQEELLAAIHGAFEVAVEIAAREVKKLLGQATGDTYEEMRRENESLRQRLWRAEAMLSSARQEGRGGSSPAKKTLLSAPEHTVHQPVSDYNKLSPDPEVGIAHSNAGGKGEAQPASDACARRHLNTQDKHMSAYEQRSDHVKAKCASDSVSEPEINPNIKSSGLKDVPEHFPTVCDVKVERILPCQDAADNQSSQLSSTDDEQMFEPAAVKLEMPEVEGSLNSIKMEDLSSECMSEVPSTILEEWKPKELDLQSQNPNTTLPYTRLTQVHPPNITKGIPLLDHPPLTSELSISQASESAPTSEAPPPIYGVHVRIRRNNYPSISNFYVCKSCNQTFPLPSLWRRHYSQCQQKLQQPRGENNRPRLQIYPPGCSPFRCTECNREFNRMENLKTHLRIHTGERPYTCSVCSKCFRHSGALTRHFRIHTGEKPYVCGQCGKSFRNCGGLRFHQRSHSKALQ